LGKAVHKVLEDFHMAYLMGSTNKLNVEMKIAFEKMLIEFEKEITPELKTEIYSMVDQYLRVVYKTGTKHVLHCELPFAINLTEDVILNGAIDRIQNDSDGALHILDYKSTKNKKYLLDDYFQLETYGFVLWNDVRYREQIEKTGYVRASYMLMRHDFELITKEISLDTIQKIPNKFIKYAEDIRKETVYEATPSPLCDYCDFQEICPSDIRKTTKQKTSAKSWV
jgi:CRISPR/Cas system-associated exonuclease Cas4 (RecB family)